MCGIVGGWWPKDDQLAKRLLLALKKIRHRGPNGSGFHIYPFASSSIALGHTRLSIIDLTDAGNQPMHSRDGRWAIIFNGEIYNYRELRVELRAMGEIFSSDSDTEVLLAAWAQWGASCLPRLIGMFAFAVLDKSNGKLTCVRDAFGIKPFFYSSEKEHFAFASELPALLELLPNKPDLNWQRSYDYLVHGDYDSTPETFYAGIHHLPSGHLIEINSFTGRSLQIKRWWQPQVLERPKWRFEDAVEQVREKFLHNIRMHLRSDVPLGAALSGGVDSSSIVCAMRYLEPDLPINTFSFIASNIEINEEKWVDRINSYVAAIPHKVRVTTNELTTDLNDLMKLQGEPFGSTSIYAQYRVFKLAKEEGMTVTLDGQGADEMLGGYNGYPGQRLMSLIENRKFKEASNFLNQWSKWPGRSKLHGLKTLVGQMTEGSVYENLRKLNGEQKCPKWLNKGALLDGGVSLKFPTKSFQKAFKGRRVMSELANSLTTRGLNSLLRHGDRNSMRFSIESRVPFLTTDLADLILSMPEHYLISKYGETKHVFKEAMKGIVPDEILNRKDKIGFETPEQDWLLDIAPTLRKWLSEPINLPFINQIELINEFNKIVEGKKPFTWQVWRWINLIQWYKLNEE